MMQLKIAEMKRKKNPRVIVTVMRKQEEKNLDRQHESKI
jgi:hypothetical protein